MRPSKPTLILLPALLMLSSCASLMKPHDREAVLAKYIAEHGVQKGNEKYADRFMDELKRDNVRVGPRR